MDRVRPAIAGQTVPVRLNNVIRLQEIVEALYGATARQEGRNNVPRPLTWWGEDHESSLIEWKLSGERLNAYAIEFDLKYALNKNADAHARLKEASENLRSATTTTDRRSAAREFLAALAELIACLLRFLVRMLILLLSRLLGRTSADDVPVWKPDPIDTAPQVAPRGPNPIFPVFLHRGGFRRSAPGSAVLAA